MLACNPLPGSPTTSAVCDKWKSDNVSGFRVNESKCQSVKDLMFNWINLKDVYIVLINWACMNKIRNTSTVW